jgi:hypothetical protein
MEHIVPGYRKNNTGDGKVLRSGQQVPPSLFLWQEKSTGDFQKNLPGSRYPQIIFLFNLTLCEKDKASKTGKPSQQPI